MLHVTLGYCPFDGTAGRRRYGPPLGRAGLAALIIASGCIAAFLGEARIASAHGVVGQRFFPATLSTDDPFVADEMSLPTVSHRKTSVDPSVKETNIDFDFAKRITPDFGIVMGYGWTHLDQLGPPHNPSGFKNLEITGQWQFLRNDPHEAVAM